MKESSQTALQTDRPFTDKQQGDNTMKKLLTLALIALGMTATSASAESSWTKLASVAPDGIQWDVYVDESRTDVKQHTGYFMMVQITGIPSGYYSVETEAVADCQRKRIKNPVFQPYQKYGKEKMDTPSGEYSQPWHETNPKHTDGVILKHLCQ